MRNISDTELSPNSDDATVVSSFIENQNQSLTSSEAAAYLRISIETLHNLTSSGQIPYYKLGRRNRYRLDELNQLLNAKKRGN